MFCFLLTGWPSYSQESRIDSLRALLESAKEDTNKVVILTDLTREFSSTDPKKALQYGKMGISLAEMLEYQTGIADILNVVGNIHRDQDNYEKALDCFQQSLKIREKTGDKRGIAACLNGIGIVYYYQGNYDKTLEYFLKSLEIEKELGNERGLASSLNNIGVVYQDQGSLDEALSYYNQSLGIRKELQDQKGISESYNNIGNIYAQQRNHIKAIDYFLMSLKITEDGGDKKGVANTLGNIGELYSDIGSYDKAVEHINRSLAVARQIDAKNEVKYAYQNLAEVFAKQGRHQQAYKYHKLFAAIKDTIYTEDGSTKMAEMEAKYEVDKERKEKELLQKDKELQNVQLNRQTMIIWFTAAGIALLLAFVFLIFRGYLQKQKVNLQLERKNESIIRQNKEIERINVDLEKLSIVASETDNSIFIMDADGNLEWANRGFTKLFGYTLEEYIKEKGSNLLEISDSPDIKTLVNKCIENKKSVVYEALNEGKDGKKHWVQTTLTPILGDNGNIKKLVAIDSDITVQKKAEHEIQEKNSEIAASIRYARGIQHAILPTDEHMKEALPENFVLFKPQSVVSGDFYWMMEKENKVYFCAADCTGHGVPGAFMSMMCSSLLSEAVNEKGLTKPSEIFYNVRKGLIANLKQAEDTQKDGMDAVLCVLDKKANSIEFAAANNSLMVINPKRDVWPENSIPFGEGWGGEIKPDKQPVGYLSGEQLPFTDHTIKIVKGDTIYIYSDGYMDQFGGPKDKKYSRKRFKELLLSVQAKSMRDQQEVLDKSIEDWKDGREQIDDILVIGVRFS